MSCLTSSYFSSIDNCVPPSITRDGTPRVQDPANHCRIQRSGLSECRNKVPACDPALQFLHQMKQVLLALPERDDFMFVMSSPCFLKAIDFALDVGALPVVSQSLEGP